MIVSKDIELLYKNSIQTIDLLSHSLEQLAEKIDREQPASIEEKSISKGWFRSLKNKFMEL
jgi:hypothetical protein